MAQDENKKREFKVKIIFLKQRLIKKIVVLNIRDMP